MHVPVRDFRIVGSPRTANPENAERRVRMFEKFENCESVVVEKTVVENFPKFTPAIVRSPEDMIFPPFVADYFHKDGNIEKLPILPQRGKAAGVEVGDILRICGEDWLRGHGVSKEQGKVISR
ncbi:MAG: hypothetical protein GY748_24585, partial [Planctomycetaceae bacterium]|nr:hypothetical protein [Planctomycetaceae bacterium]